MRYLFLPLLVVVAACSSEPAATASSVASAVEPDSSRVQEDDWTPADYSRTVENLPGSQYFYPVRVYDIAFKTIQKAFQQQADAYSVATFIEGKQLTFSFDMTNPYDKPMQAPIPDFWLQSECFNLGQGVGAANTRYNRFNHVYELSGTNLVTREGQALHEVAGAQRAASATYQLPFAPHQTRRFKVAFDKPFAADCPTVTLLGFTKSDQKPGEQIYVGLQLEVATGAITNQQTRKRNEAFVSTE